MNMGDFSFVGAQKDYWPPQQIITLIMEALSGSRHDVVNIYGVILIPIGREVEEAWKEASN